MFVLIVNFCNFFIYNLFYLDERKRVEQFYTDRGLVDPRLEVEARKTAAASSSAATSPDKQGGQGHQEKRPPPPSSAPAEDEYAQKVGVVLTTQDEDSLDQIVHRYFFCQANASVTVIKKFISLQLYQTTSKHTSVI